MTVSENPIRFEAPTNIVAPTISSSAMLVELSISTWTARRLDKGTTGEVLRDKRAERNSGSFNKNLLVGCDELEAVKKFAANVRSSAHYNMTMPWSDSGLRLLPTVKYFDYHENMTALRDEFYRLVEAFLSVYDWEVMQVQTRLGDLFSRDEYPTSESVRNKFSFTINYIPVPDVSDWRVKMNHETARSLSSQYKDFYSDQMNRAMRDVWQRLHRECDRFIKQLSVDSEGKKGKLYQSTIDLLLHLTDMMEAANFTGDPSLQLAQRKLRTIVAGLDKDDLVRNPKFREDTKTAMEDAIAALPSLDI